MPEVLATMEAEVEVENTVEKKEEEIAPLLQREQPTAQELQEPTVLIRLTSKYALLKNFLHFFG